MITMPSWYVERLLLDREIIRDQAVNVYDNGKSIRLPENDYVVIDYESDEYMDLLTVELAIKKLYLRNVLSFEDVEFIDLVVDSRSVGGKSIVESSGLERRTATGKYQDICSKIAYYLGGRFTDDGLLEYMIEKYSSIPV